MQYYISKSYIKMRFNSILKANSTDYTRLVIHTAKQLKSDSRRTISSSGYPNDMIVLKIFRKCLRQQVCHPPLVDNVNLTVEQGRFTALLVTAGQVKHLNSFAQWSRKPTSGSVTINMPRYLGRQWGIVTPRD